MMVPPPVSQQPQVESPQDNIGTISVQSLLKQMHDAGVPYDRAVKELSRYDYLLTAADKEKARQIQAVTEAQRAAQQAYKDTLDSERLKQTEKHQDAQDNARNRQIEAMVSRMNRGSGDDKGNWTIQNVNGKTKLFNTKTGEFKDPPEGYDTVTKESGSSTGGRGGAFNETMRNTVKYDIGELDKSLAEMRKDQGGVTSIFFGDKDSSGYSRFVKNELTSEDRQKYDLYANRIAPALAGLQTQGRGQVSDAKIKSAKSLIPEPGNAPEVIEEKLNYIQYLRDTSMGILAGYDPDDLVGKSSSDIKKMVSAKRGGGAGVPSAPTNSAPSFSSTADADAAGKAGKLKPGQKITINGQSGVWYP